MAAILHPRFSILDSRFLVCFAVQLFQTLPNEGDGQWPGLAPEQLYDLALPTDFRDVFAEVAACHLGATNLNMIFPGFNPTPANFRGFIRA